MGLAGVDGLTALMLAAEQGHEGIVEKLLDKCGDKSHVTASKSSGGTALMYAPRNGHEGIVEKLLDKCGDESHVTVANSSGRTALMYAAEQGHEGVVAKLLDKWSDESHVMMKCQKGYSALQYSISYLYKNQINSSVWDSFETIINRVSSYEFGYKLINEFITEINQMMRELQIKNTTRLYFRLVRSIHDLTKFQEEFYSKKIDELLSGLEKFEDIEEKYTDPLSYESVVSDENLEKRIAVVSCDVKDSDGRFYTRPYYYLIDKLPPSGGFPHPANPHNDINSRYKPLSKSVLKAHKMTDANKEQLKMEFVCKVGNYQELKKQIDDWLEIHEGILQDSTSTLDENSQLKRPQLKRLKQNLSKKVEYLKKKIKEIDGNFIELMGEAAFETASSITE